LVSRAASLYQRNEQSYTVSLKFIGGVSKKLGSVDHGLLEFSCQIKIEIDETCSDDADDIQRRMEKTYAACRQSTENETEPANVAGRPLLKAVTGFHKRRSGDRLPSSTCWPRRDRWSHPHRELMHSVGLATISAICFMMSDVSAASSAGSQGSWKRPETSRGGAHRM